MSCWNGSVYGDEEPKRLYPPPPPGLASFKPVKAPTTPATSPYVAARIQAFEPRNARLAARPGLNAGQQQQQHQPPPQFTSQQHYAKLQQQNRRYAAARTAGDVNGNGFDHGDVLQGFAETMDRKMNAAESLLCDKTEFSQDQIEYFYSMFQSVNESNTGALNFTEFRSALSEFGLGHLTNVMVKEILDSVDADGSKMVCFREFMRLWEKAADEREQSLPFAGELHQALRRLDMLPAKISPVPFDQAKTYFETKTNQLALEAILERQQILMRRARPEVTSRFQHPPGQQNGYHQFQAHQ